MIIHNVITLELVQILLQLPLPSYGAAGDYSQSYYPGAGGECFLYQGYGAGGDYDHFYYPGAGGDYYKYRDLPTYSDFTSSIY